MRFLTSRVRARLPVAEYDRLVKLLTVHYAYPLPYPLAGAYFEALFAASVGGVREERKLLFDVLKGKLGWSLKTLLCTRLEAMSQFECVVQRCDILTDRTLSLQSPVDALGAAVLTRFNASCERSADEQGVTDPRAGFLIRNRKEQDFVFFQQRYRLYESGDIKWRWANDGQKSLMGYVGESLVLRWYRSGTQLFGVYQIPRDAHSFHIDWRRAGLDETIEFFTRSGIAHADKDT